MQETRGKHHELLKMLHKTSCQKGPAPWCTAVYRHTEKIKLCTAWGALSTCWPMASAQNFTALGMSKGRTAQNNPKWRKNDCLSIFHLNLPRITSLLINLGESWFVLTILCNGHWNSSNQWWQGNYILIFLESEYLVASCKNSFPHSDNRL